jgi:LPXTG-motif cell wall-anchored protein
MKKSFLVISMTSLLIFGCMNVVIAQDQPKPKKDSVNMDNTAKPTFYYAAEDEKVTKKGDSSLLIPIIAGVVVVAGAAGFFLLKKKK